MNIEVFGRVRPPLRGESPKHVFSISDHTIDVAGVTQRFSRLYQEDTTNQQVYEDCVAPMVDLFLTGYNLSFLSLGEIQSGRSFTLLGDSQKNLGIAHMIVQAVLGKIKYNTDGPLAEASSVNIDLKMYEVYNEAIRDLLHTSSHPSELGCNPQDWFHVKNVTRVPLDDEEKVLAALKNGSNQRMTTQSDFGDDRSRATVIIQLEANINMRQFGYPHRSFLTLVDLPAIDNFPGDSQAQKRKEGISLNKSAAALQKLVENLYKLKGPSQVVQLSDESKVTSLLQDSFGGNNKTKVMVHFKPDSTEQKVKDLLLFTSQLSEVKNYFILNDSAAQGLLTGMRARILYLQRQLGVQSMTLPSANDDTDQINNDEEISKLKMENGYLARKLDRLQNQFSDVAAVKEDLSSRLISSEEERLKASRALVDFRIESNQQREKLAQENFEMKNKLMSLDSQLFQEQNERQRAVNIVSRNHHQYQGLEMESRTLADQYAELQARHETLMKKHDIEIRRNQDLGMELLNLLNAEVALIKQQGNLKNSETEDLTKIRDIAIGLTAEREKINDVPLHNLRDILFGDRDQFRLDVEKMKSVYDQQQDSLQSQIHKLNENVQKSRLRALEAQKKLAQQDVELMMKREQAKEMEKEISNLNLQIKGKDDELRRRLQKYLDDIADFVEQTSKMPHAGQILRGTVDQITEDLKKTYKSREKQLSDAARSYRQQAQRVAKKHEQLLVAYRVLRNQVHDAQDVDLGPKEYELSLSDAELESSNRQELTKLGISLKLVKDELETARRSGGSDNSIDVLKAKFQEQQKEVERERASLLASNALLEEQLAESNVYLKKEIPRYREEIKNLQRKLGMDDPYSRAPHQYQYKGHSRTYPGL